MDFTREQILHLATLARLEVSDAEIEAYQHDLSAITGYVAKLSELDVDAIEPTTHAVALTPELRADEAATPFDAEQVLALAPEVRDGQFSVPKVVDN